MDWDIAVILLYFVAIFTIGVYAGRKQKNLEDYALGGRNMPWWAILASILAAEISAATFLGAPGEGYEMRNFTYAQLAIGTIIGRIVVGKLFLKPYYEYRVVSIYEYLEKRFGLTTRRMGSMVFLISRVLASGARLYIAGIILVIGYEFFHGAVPDPDKKVELYIYALILITLATTIYTAVGGLKAVVWTDVLQACVLAVSVISAITVLLLHIPGGWSKVLEILNAPGDWSFWKTGFLTREEFLQPVIAKLGPDAAAQLPGPGIRDQVKHILDQEYTIWAAFLGSTFVTMATHGTDQDMVQRMLAAKNKESGSKAVILSGIIDMPVVLTFLFTGMLLYVYYQTNPTAVPASIKNEIFPKFIMYNLPTGIKGLLVSGVLATAMGSLSTALNSLATTAVKDWYQDIFRPKAGERELLRAVRWMTVFFAVLLIIVGSFAAWYSVHDPDFRIIPLALGLFGYTYGSLLGVFLLGMLTKTRGSDMGNVIGMVAGFLVVALFSRLIPMPESLDRLVPHIAFPWRVTIGTLVTFGIGWMFRSKATVAPTGNAGGQ